MVAPALGLGYIKNPNTRAEATATIPMMAKIVFLDFLPDAMGWAVFSVVEGVSETALLKQVV